MKKKTTKDVMRVISVRNAQGIKVRRCCASCQSKCIDYIGKRTCAKTGEKVKPDFRCSKWLMSDNCQKVGLNQGVVRDKETKEVIIY